MNIKHLIIFIISFLPFITAGQFILDMDKMPPEKQRKNEIILTPVSEKYYLNTYFKEDQKAKLGSSDPATVDEFYLSPIVLTKTSNGIDASYRGPLYAQCGGSGEDHCSIQGYSIQLDSCGALVKIDEDKTDLKIYQPGVLGKHVPIPDEDLGRMASYSNSPVILDRLYTDIAGPDLESNYILGNSIPKVPSSSGNSYNFTNRTRWGLNPWGTNTVATFFIHLSMIRKAIRQLFPDQSRCQKAWPEFLGRTPLNPETPNPASWNLVFREYQFTLRLLNVYFGDIRNYLTESIIKKELVCNNSQPAGALNMADQLRFEKMIQPLVQAHYISKDESNLLNRYFIGGSYGDRLQLSSHLGTCMDQLEQAKYLGQLVNLTRPHPPLSEAEKLSAFQIFFKAYPHLKSRGGVWTDIDQKGLKYFEQFLQNPPKTVFKVQEEKEKWDLIVQAAP